MSDKDKDVANSFIRRDDGSEPSTNQTTELVDAVLEANVELFHASDFTTYVTVGIDGHVETLPLAGARLKSWLRKSAFELFGKATTAQVISEAAATLAAFAEHKGSELEVYRRVAELDGKIYVDLVNKNRDVVVVDATGWCVTGSPRKIKFIRSQGMKALPIPAQQADLDLLRSFINAEGSEWPLLIGFLVGIMNPRGSYPVGVLMGDHGSAKSTCARLLRALTDPHVIESDTLPRNGIDLAIAAGNSHLLSYDNVSRIPADLSDTLCRLSTGGGIRKRKLYYDVDEVMISFKRPVMLNGIGDIVSRQDLIDRSIFLHLKPIDEGMRRTEEELMLEFQRAAPSIFAGILDALSAALRNKDSVKLERKPRLADFASFVCAAEEAIPIAPGSFINAYESNRASANEMVLEHSLVAAAITARFDETGIENWTGTATELLKWLTPELDDVSRKAKGWPVNGRGMKAELDRVAANLRVAGFEIEDLPRTGRSRRFEIRRRTVTTVTPSPAITVGSDDGDGNDDRNPALVAGQSNLFGGEL